MTPSRRQALGRCLLLGASLCAVPAWALTEPRHGQPPAERLGGELDLTDHHGLPFNLARLAGRPGLLFFGFMHCASTCPLALGTAREVLSQFGPQPAPPIVFVTLDPLSDGPRELREHLGRVDPRLIGLTGSPAQVSRVADRYGVGTRVRDGGVDHSSMWYLLDGAGRLRRVYPHSTPAALLLDDLKRVT